MKGRSVVITLVALGLSLGVLFYTYNKYRDLQKKEICLLSLEPASGREAAPEGQVAEGIHYKNVQLGGKSFADAAQTLAAQQTELLSKLGKLQLSFPEAHLPEEETERLPQHTEAGLLSYDLFDLGLRLDIDRIIQQAEQESKKIFGRNLALVDAMTLDQAAFDAAMTRLAGEVNQKGSDARAIGFNIDEERFEFEPEQEGRELDQAQAEKLIRQALEAGEYQKKIELPVKVTPPGRTAEELSKKLGLVDSASTPIISYSEARNFNVQLAADRIHGLVLRPGESFSFHEVVGEQGFVEAGIQDAYGNDGLGMGGGICQVSTTLYIAAVRSNMRIDVHNFHTQPVAYCPLGSDAMVSDWSDLVFTNTSEYPYAISMYFDGSTLAASFYGPENPDGAKIDLYVKELEQIPSDKKPIEELDKTLEPGERQVKVSPRPARHVMVYKQFYAPDGSVINSELMYDHVYPSFEGVDLVGKKEDASQSPSGAQGPTATQVAYYTKDAEGNIIPVYETLPPQPTSPPPLP